MKRIFWILAIIIIPSLVFSQGVMVFDRAADIVFTPAGDIEAVEVQAAIEELDTEKQSALGYTPVNASDWTTHDDYPAACSAGEYINAIGDTSTCVNATTEIDSAILTHKGIASAHHVKTVDTGPSPDCSGATTYQNGEAGCVDLDWAYSSLSSFNTHITSTSTHGVTGDILGTTDAQTLTNKVIDGDLNTLSDIATASLKTKTGADANVATGTAGGAGVCAEWNADGDLVEAVSGLACGSGEAGGAPTDAAYITQVATSGLSAEQAMGDLGTGIVKNTTTTGVQSIAVADTDYAPPTAPTFATSITGSYLTASEILITGASKEIISASVATYPSLAEFALLKGMTSKVIDDDQIDTFSELDAIVADKDLVNKADGADWLGVHDYSDAFVTLPSTIGTAEGAARWSSEGEAFEVYSDGVKKAISAWGIIDKTLWDPDGIQSTEDAVPLMYVHPTLYPYGITLGSTNGVVNDGIQLFADQSNSGSVAIEEWSYEGVHLSDAATITFANSTVASTTAVLSDASIASGNRVFIDLNDTDLNFLETTIPWYANGKP